MQHLLRIHPIQFQQDKEHPHKFEVKNENILSETTVATVSLREKYRRKIAIENTFSRSGAGLNIRPHWPLMSFFKFMNEDTGRETTSKILSDVDDNTQEIYNSEVIDNTQEIYVTENIDSPSDINNYVIGDGDSLAHQSNINIIEDMPTTVTRNKRKKQISENTEEEEEEVDSVLATVLRAVSSIAETPKKKNKACLLERVPTHLDNEDMRGSDESSSLKNTSFIVSSLENFLEYDSRYFRKSLFLDSRASSENMPMGRGTAFIISGP
ncbi:hypothetical protein NQ314_015147 [Rhamnusium bicolor]|uniref:Uncharacterized protein n=1 Tax=Rhamnusium bicolor TaxID=1586634 RepID=A0AAV8X044_9CUCU|nr:hypothetical protein NQ314_015147 [Rhamnusium bicolor]